jgi:chaperonin GroES
MKVTEDNKLKKIIIVGDRVLIKPKKLSDKTNSGLYLPPGVHEREKIQSGYVIKTGPGYPIPIPGEEEEPWKPNEEKVKYIPLQAQEGDLAIFLQNGSIEIVYEQEKYFIVPQASILMLERDEDLTSR